MQKRMEDRLIEHGAEKVIFLDVDGVLNINKDGSIIEKIFVERLAKIVQNTGAKIILSSSWRYGYVRHIDKTYPYHSEHVDCLIRTLRQYGLQIEGITPIPIALNGPSGRPFEIRSWLGNQANVKRFVILDDETFWQWNWLGDFVVCTTHEGENQVRTFKTPSGKEEEIRHKTYQYGLTDSDVEKAIEILNRPIVQFE